MNRYLGDQKIIRYLSISLFGFSTLCLIVWFVLRIDITRFDEDVVTMKWPTAGLFVVYFAANLVGRRWLRNGLSYIVLISAISLMLFQNDVILNHGIEGVASELPVYSVAPDMPSNSTLLLFIIFSAAQIVDHPQLWRITRVVSLLVCLCVWIGYAFGVPDLYFYREGSSSAMAISTSILFAGAIATSMASEHRPFA